TGGSATSTVTGVVYARDAAENPVADATVSVVGTQLSTTTNQRGEFTLENVPNGAQFFATEAAGNWGVVDYWDVPEETQFGADFGVIPDADIQDVAATLGRTISADDGAVDVTFDEGAAGGETASITASSDPPFTFNLAGVPVEQPGVIADEDGYGDLIFTSVDPGDGPVGATVAGVPGSTTCLVDEDPGTTYPIIAKSITIVYAYCF
ncbi:MAG: carboxypeptidase regulatory-like domain-containing protein, partial [Polyangiales bacterium]